MRHRTHTIFDDYIQSSTPTGTTVWTDARHNVMLGEHDMLALHALGDNASATGHVRAYVQHSSDGRNWLFRATGSLTPPGTSEIDLIFAAVSDFKQVMWSDACLGTSTLGPLLSFVRLQITADAGVGAHLKIHATLRGGR